jgi:molybdopterin converting factor small subunit
MGVKIRIPKVLQDKANGVTLADVKGKTVRDCFEALIKQFPGLEGHLMDTQGVLLLKWMLYVNHGSISYKNELSYPVKDGDLVELLPVLSGG